MLCKNRITLIGFLGQDAESRSQPIQDAHRIAPSDLVEQAGRMGGNLPKGAYVEVEGELRYRKYTSAELDRSVRLAEIYVRARF